MKKFIFIIICLFSFVFVVKAEELAYENTNYYIKTSNKIINIKKVYDKDTLEVVFNIDPYNYDTSNNYKVTNKFIYKDKYNDYYENFLYTIIYYSYLENPSDLNYYYTQIMLWYYVSGLRFTMTNHLGDEVPDLKDDYNKLVTKVIMHDSKPSFFNDTYNKEIWDTSIFKYNDNNKILDNPKLDELDIKTNNKILTIYNRNVGNYKLEFIKDYEQEVKCYEIDNKPVYCMSLKGPKDIKFILEYNVYGTKLLIKEKLIGINNRFGDVLLNSTYEIYLDNELKLITNDLDNIYVKSNNSYTIKDVSSNESTYNINDINLNIENEEYVLEIDKQVISKNISITINNDKNYYVYLKSNNELYEVMDKNTDLIILPYGTYYITDNNDYYLELNVFDDIDDELIIEEDEILKENISIEQEEYEKVENPKTGDFICFHIFTFLITIHFILLLKYLK